MLTHHLIHVWPGTVYTVTVDIFSAIEHIVEDLDAQMRHTDLVHIRETHAKQDIDGIYILRCRIDLVADVARRLLD